MPPKKKAKKVKKTKTEDVDETEQSRNLDVRRRKDCPDCASLNIVFEPETEKLICQDCGSIFHELPSHLEKKYDDFDLF